MRKKLQKNKYLLITILAFFLMVGVAGANQNLRSMIADRIGDNLTQDLREELQVEEPTVGAFPGGDIYTPVNFFDKVGFGDDRRRTDYFYKALKFTDATSTPVSFSANENGYNDFYLVDLWLENTGKATTTTRICVTTSTSAYLNPTTVDYLDGDAGTCTLMRTLGNAFGADGAAYNGKTATSSQFSIGHYPGTDTRVAANKLNFLMSSTTKILVFATSSSGDTGITYSANTFDGVLHLIGRESNR